MTWIKRREIIAKASDELIIQGVKIEKSPKQSMADEAMK